jgi:isochorismate pyruvate lyase
VASAKSKAKSKKAKAKSKAKPKAKSKRTSKPAKRAAKTKDWRITCKSLGEIRQNIDRLDNLIVPLLCQRLHFVTQAANFKPSVAGVVVPSRVEEIINRVREAAAAMGSNPDTLERVYRSLIDAFTADEQHHWQVLNKTDAP